jgi:hypothetical protein
MRAALALVVGFAAACAPEESATKHKFDARIQVAADGVLDLDGVALRPDATTPEEREQAVVRRLVEISKRRRRPANPQFPEGPFVSDIVLVVTIDPRSRADQFLPVLACSSLQGIKIVDVTLATSDGSRSNLPVKLDPEIGISNYSDREDGRASLVVLFSQSTAPNTWSVFEEPADEQAVHSENLTWIAARDLVDERRPFGGRLRLVNHVPAHTTWSELAPRIERALTLEPLWVEFGWDE